MKRMNRISSPKVPIGFRVSGFWFQAVNQESQPGLRRNLKKVSKPPGRVACLPQETMKRNKEGFTLIELLVVMAIIGILASILFPVFAKAKLAAKASVCLSNQGQIGKAFILYCDEYDQRWCPTLSYAP